jgi:hypothetical protein
MAVDKSLFKPEARLEDKQVFKKRTMGNVVLIFALCVLAIVCWWPEDTAHKPFPFWLMIVVAPFAASAIGGFLLLMRRQNQAMDVAYENQASARVKDYVIEAASRPLAVLAVSYQHGSVPLKESSKEIRGQGSSHALKLGEVYWFAHPERDPNVIPGHTDILRRRALTSRIFTDILRDISPSLAALPSSVPCVVHLFMSNHLRAKDNISCWTECVEARALHNFSVVYSKTDEQGIMSLDTWMDDFIAGDSHEARLYIGVQLLPYASRPLPPAGSTEAAAAVLLVPNALALRHRLQKEGDLHRPVKSSIANHAKSVSDAILFAGVKGQEIGARWYTGVSAAQRGLLTIAQAGQDVVSPAVDMDIDKTIGVTGIAAPWFAIACANASLQRGAGASIITVGREDELHTMVVKPPRKKWDGSNQPSGAQ